MKSIIVARILSINKKYLFTIWFDYVKVIEQDIK